MSSNSLLWSTIRPPPLPGPAVTEKCPGTALYIHTPIVFLFAGMMRQVMDGPLRSNEPTEGCRDI